MRVALVLGTGTGAGTVTHAHSLARGLVAGADQVDVYAATALADRVDFAAVGAELTGLEIPPGPGPRDVAAISALRRALRLKPVDVVHAFGLRAGLVAGLARPAGVPLAVTWSHTLAAHGVRRTTDRALARVVAGTAEVTLCPTAELAELAQRLGARRVLRVPMVAPARPPAGADRVEVRAEFSLPPAAPLVLAVGRLDADRHHEVLVAAAARWRTLIPPPTVLIAGVGPAYRDLAAQAVIARAPVILVGQRDDLADLLSAADVAVLTGAVAASPLFVQEALAAGVALVAPAQPGIEELVGAATGEVGTPREVVAASLVPVGDVDALDAAVRTLLSDPDLRSDRVAAGLARAATWSTEAEMVAAARAAYGEILGPVAVAEEIRDAPGDLR